MILPHCQRHKRSGPWRLTFRERGGGALMGPHSIGTIKDTRISDGDIYVQRCSRTKYVIIAI
jgi:hypothetical protein